MFLSISVLDVLAGRCVASRSARGVSAGVEIVSFFHVSLFRNYRTLSIALRCFISFRFRFVFSCLFTSFHALFCLLCFALHPHVCFGIFLSFQVSSCCSCIVLFFFYIFCYCPARWRGAPRPARLRGAWRGNRPSGAGWWASPPRCDVTDCTPSRMSCCIFQSGRYSPFGCFFWQSMMSRLSPGSRVAAAATRVARMSSWSMVWGW